jgi:hypothetical protein
VFYGDLEHMPAAPATAAAPASADPATNGAEPPRDSGREPLPGRVAHGALRGAIAAMAMSGMRELTVHAGLVDEPPPRAILRQRVPKLLRSVPRRRRPVVVELAHWGYGAMAGGVFGALPDGLRRRRWSGPVYGLAIWLSFEAGIAPALGLRQAKEVRPVERLAFAADHLLYGLVLSELRARPRD